MRSAIFVGLAVVVMVIVGCPSSQDGDGSYPDGSGSGAAVDGTSECSPGCRDYWISDGECDAACNSAVCAHDGGDCSRDGGGAGNGGGSTGGPGPCSVPAAPTFPAPGDEERNVPLQADALGGHSIVELDWWSSATATRYMVAISTNRSFPDEATEIWGTSASDFAFVITAAEHRYGTTYYWRTYAVNDCGFNIGPIWSFTTESDSEGSGGSSGGSDDSRCPDKPVLFFSGDVATAYGTLSAGERWYCDHQLLAENGDHVVITVSVVGGSNTAVGIEPLYPTSSMIAGGGTSTNRLELGSIGADEPPGPYCICINNHGGTSGTYTLTVTR